MTKKQQNKILQIIAKDCEIRHQYLIEEDKGRYKTCVIGRLLLESGVSKRALVAADTHLIFHFPKFRKILHRDYGLSDEQSQSLQWANDAAETMGKRRKNLRSKVKTFLQE